MIMESNSPLNFSETWTSAPQVNAIYMPLSQKYKTIETIVFIPLSDIYGTITVKYEPPA